MFKTIIEGHSKQQMILIKDKLGCSGMPLLLQFIQKMANRWARTDVFCLNMNSEMICSLLPKSTCRFYHPVYKTLVDDNSDPMTNLNGNLDLFNNFTNCCQNTTCDNRAVVIDSFSHLLLNNGLSKTIDTLNKLIDYSEEAGIKFQLVGLLHGDVHEEAAVHAIEYLFPVLIQLESGDSGDLIQATVTNKKATGVSSKEIIHYKICDNVLQITDKILKSKKLPEESQKSENLLSSNLTFKLSLKEDEKESRAKVILPYERHRQVPNSSSSCINYEFERDDDFDEDDPDDDLNI